MPKRELQEKTPTMIIPAGSEIRADVHGQLNIRTPGNLVIENSGNYGTIESQNGSIRIESSADVEAVHVQCAETCYVEGSLTAWKVEADAIRLEDKARANIVLQETGQLQIGREARLVGNFSSERELFLMFSRFANQLRSLPLFAEKERAATDLHGRPLDEENLLESHTAPPPTKTVSPEPDAEGEGDGELPETLFFALVLLEREFGRSAYGPTSQRVIEELVKLLQERDLETLELTYRTLCARIVDPGGDVQRAYELMKGHFASSE
jgi:cytoskeletal protein CcmA (bactofilin family)